MDDFEAIENYPDREVEWETARGRDVRLGACKYVDLTTIYHKEDYCDGRMSLPLMVAMLVLGFVTVLVNLGVILRTIKLLRHSQEDKPAFYFICNLALSDLTIGLYVVVSFLLHVTHKSDLWHQGSCMLHLGVPVTVCQETIFTIMLIAIDKYLYICHGLHYGTIVTTKRVYGAIGLSWGLSILIGSLPAMGLHVSWEAACRRCSFPQVISTDFAIIFFLTSVAVPLAVVVSLYSLLLLLALRMQKARYGGSYTANEASRSNNFRLSFMSKSSSKSSSTKTGKSSLSTSSSTSSAKAERRRTRRKEMAEYKASLPGLEERDTKLILYRDQQKAAPHTPQGPQDADMAVDVPFRAEVNGKEAGGAPVPVEDPATPPPAGEEQESDKEGKACAPARSSTAGPKTLADEGDIDTDFNTDDLPPLTSDDEGENTTKHLPGGTADERRRGWGSWFPSKYMNRVVTDTRDKVLFLKKCRAVKTVLLILLSFSATYVPFVVGTLVYSAQQEKHECLLHWLSTLLYCAVVANSLANPLIYAYGYREFRLKTKKFKGIFAREKTRRYS